MDVRRRSVESGRLEVRGEVVGGVRNNSDLECRFERKKKRYGVESEFGKEEVRGRWSSQLRELHEAQDPPRPFERVERERRSYQRNKLRKRILQQSKITRKTKRRKGYPTYNKSLVKLGTQQTFLPVVTNDTAHRLGQALLDSKGEARAVIDELGVDFGKVLRRRRKAARRGRLPSGRIHDGRFGDNGQGGRGTPGGLEDGRRGVRGV